MTTQAAEPDSAPDPHTTAGKLADLERRRHEAVHAGSEQAVAKQHERGKKTARERIDMLLDPGSFTEFDELARHRAHDFGIEATRPYGDGVVTGYGTVDGRPVCVFSQDFTVFGGSLGEVYGEKIVKIMDHALKTGCPIDRDQRRRRRQDPGGRGRARPVRRDLLPQRDGLRRRPADLADHGPVRGRRGLLPGHHRLHPDGRGHQPHVHHRPGRDQDGDRRGREVRGPRRRAGARRQVGRRALPGPGRAGLHRLRPRTAVLPALQQPGRASGGWRPRSGTGPTRRTRPTRNSTRSSPTRRTSPTTCTR